jgi:hypothetical protein
VSNEDVNNHSPGETRTIISSELILFIAVQILVEGSIIILFSWLLKPHMIYVRREKFLSARELILREINLHSSSGA